MQAQFFEELNSVLNSHYSMTVCLNNEMLSLEVYAGLNPASHAENIHFCFSAIYDTSFYIIYHNYSPFPIWNEHDEPLKKMFNFGFINLLIY